MTFIHDDREFEELLRIVATNRGLGVALVEKDYWVTHTLWALQDLGLDVWFKGGTSLSKGFGLIERFSEDLDLKIESGRVSALPLVENWKSEGSKATATRKAYFEALAKTMTVAGAKVRVDTVVDQTFRSVNYRVEYPGRYLADLAQVMRPFVLLEIGNARVAPFIARDMTSFVHEHLEANGLLADYDVNQPRAMRCVHPLVTLIEKLDALMRRVPRDAAAPATFVRHFEDAARIAAALDDLPGLPDYASVRALAEEMHQQKQIAALPDAAHPAFNPADDERWRGIGAAHAAIAPMCWGARIDLQACCTTLRAWIARELA